MPTTLYTLHVVADRPDPDGKHPKSSITIFSKLPDDVARALIGDDLPLFMPITTNDGDILKNGPEFDKWVKEIKRRLKAKGIKLWDPMKMRKPPFTQLGICLSNSEEIMHEHSEAQSKRTYEENTRKAQQALTA